MSLTDARRLWKLADERGSEGIHSHDIRRLGISGNPSQRAKDIADHVAFWTRRERRNGRPGSRYWTDGNQPDDAVAVRSNGDVGGGDAAGLPSSLGSVAPSDADTPEPVAIVRDYDGTWSEVPVSQLGLGEAA